MPKLVYELILSCYIALEMQQLQVTPLFITQTTSYITSYITL